ncbi:DUF2382 domain-containing protein [Roseomonas sp. BN140053]|uniref:YsnF/AvaK domain-containing protein n=1 Tax=Roseomonas sp. BN140053 TaxID=3391898 RepID=UPI0039EACDD4
MTRTITGLFDSRDEANEVVEHLLQHDGIERSHIRIHATDATTAGAASTADDKGFWASLKDLFIPDEDRYAYSEGIRRGGVVVSAEVPDNLVEHAADVFEQHGAVDLDTREAQWRSEGWSSYAGDAVVGGSMTPAGGTVTAGNTAIGASTAGSTLGTGSVGTSTAARAPMATGTAGLGQSTAAHLTGTAATASGTTGTAARTGGEEVIPIVEEQIRIGKRETNHGRVRVRSYVVETPVNEQVMLREERVNVERRAVDLPVTAADDVFRERTIEAVEHAEEAVVAKEARVVEEVVIRKDATERTETVHDTVRRTEVQVEDDRTAAGTTTPVPPNNRG